MVLQEVHKNKLRYASLLDDKEIESFISRNFKNQQLLFQATFTCTDWDAHYFITLWKMSDTDVPLLIQIGETENRFSHLTGFDRPLWQLNKMDLLKTKSIGSFISFIEELKLNRPDFIIPVLVAAFEAEDKKIFLNLKYGRSDKFILQGGSCFSTYDKNEVDTNYDRVITKKVYLEERNSLIKQSMNISEEYREEHVSITTHTSEYIINQISTRLKNESRESDELDQFEKMYLRKSKKDDWIGILNEANNFNSWIRNLPSYWSMIGNAHRGINQNLEAAQAYSHSLSIDPNDSYTISLLGSSYFLLGTNGYFYDWINNNIEKLNIITQDKVITNLETKWKGYLDYKSLKATVLILITKWRTKQENDLSKSLNEIQINIKEGTQLLPVMQKCLKEKRLDLLSAVLGLNLVVDDKDMEKVAQLLTGLLDSGEIRFEDVPDSLKSGVIEISALKAMETK